MALSFSHAVLAWAKSKPADEAYQYTSNCRCAIAQFLRETGRADEPLVAGNLWTDGLYGHTVEDWRAVAHPFDQRVDDAANDLPNTFGAFAARLEKALS